MTTTQAEADILDRLHAQLVRGTDPVTDAVLADAVSEIEWLRKAVSGQ